MERFAKVNELLAEYESLEAQMADPSIHADQNNNILKITPVVDTWGDWETSRCNEILK